MAGRRLPCHVDDVLDADGHAMQRPALAACAYFALGFLRLGERPHRESSLMNAFSCGSSASMRSEQRLHQFHG